MQFLYAVGIGYALIGLVALRAFYVFRRRDL